MALSLQDFTQNGLTLEDFANQPKLGYTPNERTASMVAGAQTAITGAQKETYDQTRARLLDPAEQEAFTIQQQQIRDAMWDNYISPNVGEILSDPTVEVQAKDQLVNMVRLPPAARMPLSTTSTLAYTAARAELGPNATVQADESRLTFLDQLKQVDEDRRRRQAAINALELGKDQGTAGNIVDIAEVMAPFAEWINIDQIQKSVTKSDKAWYESSEGVLLGEMKKNLYEQIDRLPYDQRAEFTERVLQIIQDQKTVILPDGNDMVALETLNRMLIDNDYSETERWFDNITSVLDIAGIGGSFRSLVKSSKASKAAKAAKVAEKDARDARIMEGINAEADAAPELRAGLAGDNVPADLADEAASFTPEPEPTGLLADEAAGFVTAADDLGPMADEAAAFKAAQAAPKAPTPLEEEVKAFIPEDEPTAESVFGAMADNTRSEVPPTAPSQVVKDANPEVARSMHEAAMADGTGEFAKATYGTSRVEAAAKDLLPEPDMRKGKVENKVDMTPEFLEDPAVRSARISSGNHHLSDAEIVKDKGRLVNYLSNVEGMKLHKDSLLMNTLEDGTMEFVGRYSPIDSGFATWEEAVANAKFSFRRYGLQDKDFIPMARQGAEWVPIDPKDIGPRSTLKGAGANLEDIDYAVGLKWNYRHRPEDLEIDDLLTTGPLARFTSILDSATGDAFAKMKQGSFTQNLLDPASVIDPRMVEAAYLAVDKAHGIRKVYLDQLHDFVDLYKAIDPPRRDFIRDYIHEANYKGIPFSLTDLNKRGFNLKEIKALKSWRRAMDNLWYAFNEDMVKSLRAKGKQVFIHDDSKTKLFGAPQSRGAVGPETRVYDATTNKVVKLSKEDLDKLYEGGGSYMKLDETMDFNGQGVDHILVPNSVSGGYARAIYDGEIVMPYREGYYPVTYEANYFIEKVFNKGTKEEYKKVVASARDSGELKEALRMLRKAEPDYEFVSRKDRRIGETNDMFDEGSWNLVTNSGMSSQRFRGERLMDAGDDMHKMGNNHLMDPLEAVNQQIFALSNKVSTRDFMEASKNRWLQNYGKFLDLPKDSHLRGQFPTSVGEIVGKEGTPARVVRDAKTYFNYLYSLQNGYINYIDDLWKGSANFIADQLGEMGWYKAQRGAFEVSKGSPTRAARTTAFKMFISLNAPRQAVINRAQIAQLAVANPSYAATKLIPDMMDINVASWGGPASKRGKELWKELEGSGLLEAVNAHELLRNDARRLADLTYAQKARTKAMAPVDFMQRVGFDAAERDVLVSAYLSFRDEAVKAGKNPKNIRVKDEILAKARAYTGGMNRAGDLAYSQNTFSMMTQFLSFRHKMLLQPISNRHLSKVDRAKLTAFNIAIFGVDAALISALVNSMIGGEPSQMRDTLEHGLLDVGLNRALTAISGEEQMVDWGDLAPTEAYGMGNTFLGFLTSDLTEMVANAPAGSLLFGANPRLLDAFKTGARAFVPAADYDDPELQTKFTDVVKAFASMASGFSSFFKADYALEVGKKMSASGNITDEDVTKLEGYLALFGFQTKTEVGYRKTYEVLYGSQNKGSQKSGAEGDIEQWYKELKRHLARRGDRPAEAENAMRVLSEAWRVFGKDRPGAMEVITSLISKDAKDKDFTMINGLLNRMGIMTEDEMWEVARALPPGKARDMLVDTLKAKEEMTDGN